MRLKATDPAPAGHKFGKHAFVRMVGRRIPFTAADGTETTAVVVGAEVEDGGDRVYLDLDVDLGAWE